MSNAKEDSERTSTNANTNGSPDSQKGTARHRPEGRKFVSPSGVFKLEVLSLESILHDTSSPPSPIIDDGVLLENTLLLIYGMPKSRKSFLAYDFAIAIAVGRDFAGFRIPNARGAMVMSAEGGYYPGRKRIQAMCKAVGVSIPDHLHFVVGPRLNLREPEAVDLVRAALSVYRPEVLVIDPLVRFHNAEENSATEMSQVFGALRALMEDFGLSVILVHHCGKDANNKARGSSAIMGEYDSAIEILSSKRLTTLKFDMRHVETPGPRSLIFDPDSNWFRLDIRDKIARALLEKGEPLPLKDLATLCKMKGLYSSVENAYRAIRESEKNGAIQKLGSGLYVYRN